MDIIPFDKRDGFIWMDGEMVAWTDATIHVLTHGLHYASCVFEGERAYGGSIFKSREHSERLHQSARLLGFEIPYSVEAIEAAKREVLTRNKIIDGYVRPVAWRGSEMMAISAQHTKIHVAIASWAWPSMYKKDITQQGIRMTMATFKRPSPECAPTASKAAGLYMICTISKHAAELAGFDDALMLDYRGYLAEATGANLFLVIDGQIHTPLADCFLDGITRRTVIGLARDLGIAVHERHILPAELARAQEVFLTGTAAEITPVRAIDGQNFVIGTVTQALLAAFAKATRAASSVSAA